MALTELQLPTKDRFFAKVKNAADSMNNAMHQWSELAEFLANVETVDLDTMVIAAGQVRTDLVDFRIVLNEMVAFFEGTSTTQTKAPETIVDLVRSM